MVRRKQSYLTDKVLVDQLLQRGETKLSSHAEKIMQCYETDVEELIKYTYPLYLKIISGSFQPWLWPHVTNPTLSKYSGPESPATGSVSRGQK